MRNSVKRAELEVKVRTNTLCHAEAVDFAIHFFNNICGGKCTMGKCVHMFWEKEHKDCYMMRVTRVAKDTYLNNLNSASADLLYEEAYDV